MKKGYAQRLNLTGMHDQLLSDDAGSNANARKQYLHKHLSNFEAASTVVQRCETLSMQSAMK